MYTNIPKGIGTPYSMVSDIAAEDFQAKYYEQKYFGTNTGEGLDKDTYVKADSDIPQGKNLTFKDKLRNFWNGTGGNVAKWLGLAATALILFKKGKSGKIAQFLEKHGIKIGKETAKAGEEAAKKSSIMSKISDFGKDLLSKIKEKTGKVTTKVREEAAKKSDIMSKLSEFGKTLKAKAKELPSKIGSILKKGKTTEVATDTTIKALPAAQELLKLPAP